MSEKDASQQEDTNLDEELELDTELEDTEDVETLKENLSKERIAKAQILARAKKAEAALKAKKPAEATQTTTNENALTADDIDIRVLKLQGMSDDVLEMLKKVAKVNGQTLIDAQKDGLFISMKEKYDAEKKSEKASLGASHGSGSARKGKDFKTAGLSDEDHKEMWKQQNER